MHNYQTVPKVILAALAMSLAAGAAAAGDRAGKAQARHAATEIIATVVDASGAPVSDAIVVTSIGGQKPTGHDGLARIPVQYNAAQKSANVTAVAVIDGRNHTGSAQVNLSPRHHEIDAGVITVTAGGTCEPEWIPNFAGEAGTNGTIYALTVFDDGNGPALYAGGFFTLVGGLEAGANYIAKWDGTTWSARGSGLDSGVAALAVFDDGSGDGPALYAGGAFSQAGGKTAQSIAKWDGSEWSGLDSGIDDDVRSLAVFDDGEDSALYVGGDFTTADGLADATYIAKWDGLSWSTVGGGLTAPVRSMTVYHDGVRPALYVGGLFSESDAGAAGAGFNHIAKWDGKAWDSLDQGVSGTAFPFVSALAVFDDGAGDGPSLYVGGSFDMASGVIATRIAKWDGTEWSAVGNGVSGTLRTLTVFNDGSGDGPALFAGGSFTSAGDVTAWGVAQWDGASWSPLGSGTNNTVEDLAVFDAGSASGEMLFVGGDFSAAGDLGANHIAQWGCPEPQCAPADLNCDGAVNVSDMLSLLSAWGPCAGKTCPEDLNGDGDINVSDLLILLENWG